jgi:hypothetical protein
MLHHLDLTQLPLECCYWDWLEQFSFFVSELNIQKGEQELICDRHGLDPSAVLLAFVRLWRLTTIRNKIRVVGFGMHAICIVSLSIPIITSSSITD